jgi:hypothetical protein
MTYSANLSFFASKTSNTGNISITGTALTLQDATDNTKTANFVLSGLTTGTNYTYTLPAVTGVALASLGNISQTFLGATTFAPTTASSTLILGSTTGTGTITIGRSTVNQTANIATGATASGNTKTINIGTGGLALSTTRINMGNIVADAALQVNGELICNQATNGGNPLTVTGDTIYGVGTQFENTNAANASYTILTLNSGITEPSQLALVATLNPINTTAIEIGNADLYIRGSQTWIAAGRIGDIYLQTNYNVSALKLTGDDNSATFYGTLLPATGATTLAPLKLTTGTLLTTPVEGAIEFSGSEALFFTPNTTSGRSFISASNYRRLIAAGTAIVGTIANFFGGTSNISLVASDYYEIEIYMLAARGSSAGTATITLTNSAAPTLMLVDYEQSPITGVVTPPGAANKLGGTTTTTSAVYSFTTGSLTASVNHYFRFKIWLRNGSGTSLKIQMTAGATNNSMTPQAGSYYTVRTLPNAQTGTFAA